MLVPMFPKRGAIALVTTALALMLLLQFKTPAEMAAAPVAQVGGSTSSQAPNATTNPTASQGTSSGATATATATVTGSVVSTRYGDVEVRVTIANGTITAVEAIALPSGGRSGQISSYAAPVLASEVLTAQSASIDTVSGATYTSAAYAQSLQAALDQAGISTTQVSG
jgi:uncharacterized protein with FMN-binding domain